MPSKTLDSAALDRAAGTEAANVDVQRKETLLKAGALQDAILNSANFSSIATDAKGVIQIFNVGAERMLGYAAADVMNKITPADISDPQEVIARAKALSAELCTPITPGFEALVFKASRGIEDIYELTYIRKDGSRFPAVVSVTALRDAQDAIIGYLLIGTDNTARKRVEEQLRWTEESFRLMVESVTDYAIVMLDPEGRVMSWNSGAQRIKGYSAEEVVGQHFSRFYPREDIDRGVPQRDLNAVTAKGRFEDEGWRIRKNGLTFWANVAMTAIRDKDGNLRGFANLTRDLTEPRKVEAELRAQTHLIAMKNVELEQANAMKSEFLANMSHELRTPLNAIIGFSEILKDGMAGTLTDGQLGFILDIHASGEHLLALINDILDLSKVEAGMMELEPELMDIGQLFQASLTVVKEKAMVHRLRLALEIEPDLPPFAADPRRLKQIVYNLLANAVKFTPDGGTITLAARRVPRAGVGLPANAAGVVLPLPPPLLPQDAGEYCEISVSDSGIGIEAAYMEKLFRPFMQIDSSLARQHQGTGLGLAMVKNLAALQGGTVAVTSEPERGSRFTVWLPLDTALPAQAAPRAAALPLVQRGPGKPLALVIEDDDAAARIIELQLQAEGFQCMRAATGEEGLARAAKQPPQLITLDILLPNIDGWEVLERLKTSPKLAGIPVVIISIATDLEHGISLGATRVLHKPFTRDELVAALGDAGVKAEADEPVTVLIVDDTPQAVDLLASHVAELGVYVLRAYGGREAIAAAQRLRPDLILLGLMMPDVSGFEVVEALKSQPDTAAIPILVITAKQLSADHRAVLNSHVTQVMQRAAFSSEAFVSEVRRALQYANGKRGRADNS